MNNPNVVVIGMFDSIHFAGWLKHFAGRDVRLYLFPSSPHRRLHPDIKKLTNEFPKNFVLPSLHSFLGLPAWLLDRVLGDSLRSFFLTRLLVRVGPSFVHALEIQHAGYLLSRALERIPEPKFQKIVTNYGSDIFWFRRIPQHAEKISRLLQQTDYYLAECARDIELARQLGFSGTALPVYPNSGGYKKSELPDLRWRGRKTIAIKGYHGWVGRAKIALDALKLLTTDLSEHKIVVYSANLVTIAKAASVRKATGLDIKVFGKGKLSRLQMKEIFLDSEVYVGVSLSDGISTSMLEAMVYGAIPVQTATSCCDEWFHTTGIALEKLSAEEVARGIRAALKLAKDSKNIEANRATVLSRASASDVEKNALAAYGL